MWLRGWKYRHGDLSWDRSLLNLVSQKFNELQDAALKCTGVERASKLGLLTGLDSCGCFVGATALCLSCHRALKGDQLPGGAAVSGSWPGVRPEQLLCLNAVEQSMIGIYNNVVLFKMLPNGILKLKNVYIYLLYILKLLPDNYPTTGGALGMTSPSFAIVNNLAHIAKELPRLPDANVIVQLIREGSKSTSTNRATFCPARVNVALRWLFQLTNIR